MIDETCGVYIDGNWRSTAEEISVRHFEDETFDKSKHTYPSHYTAADNDDVKEAVRVASSAADGLTIVERANMLEELAELVQENKQYLTECIIKEAGKPISSARGEVEATIERFNRAVEEVRALNGTYQEGTTSSHEDWQSIVKPVPLGAIGVISPYNYPLLTTVLQVAPALAAGNGVVIKPSSKTPGPSVILAELFDTTEFPSSLLNVVVGDGETIGTALAQSDIDMVALTGSTTAGQTVASNTSVTRLQMELGGNAPALVFPDADTDEAASECVAGSLKYGGQRCSAVSRIIAHEKIVDELVENIMREVKTNNWGLCGLYNENTKMAPLIDETQAEWVGTLIDDAVEKGASVELGGERHNEFFEPTVLTNVPHNARIITEEQFGPVVVITNAETEQEMMKLANGGELTLDASLFTNNHSRIMRCSDKINAGTVRVNGAPSHGLGDVPFGGMNKSGIGRQGLHVTIENMLTTKSIIL